MNKDLKFVLIVAAGVLAGLLAYRIIGFALSILLKYVLPLVIIGALVYFLFLRKKR